MASHKPMQTVKVTQVISLANDFMAGSADSARLDRLHVAEFVKTLLHETRTYAGFNYLQPYGTAGADSSRVVFYVHRDLQV